MAITRYIYSLKQKNIERGLRKNSSEHCIYMFHEIKDNLSLCNDPNCAITENGFATLVESLVKAALVVKKDALFAPQLTFDDGYDDVYTKVYPLLNQKDLPFTVFVVTDLIGRNGYLSKEQLLELADNPLCTIGCHTYSHKMLRFCDDSEAKRQIIESKAILENLIGKKVELFAYPYGSVYACSKRDIGIVEGSGFKYAFSTLQAPLPSDIEKIKFFLPRYNVCEANYKRYLR